MPKSRIESGHGRKFPLQKRELLVQLPVAGHIPKGLCEVARFLTDGELCLLYKPMARNLKRYYQAWELHQQGKTFKAIGEIMKITGSRANVLSNFIDFKIKYQKQRRISNELKELVKKYNYQTIFL